jgi:hypothetical protein
MIDNIRALAVFAKTLHGALHQGRGMPGSVLVPTKPGQIKRKLTDAPNLVKNVIFRLIPTG